MYISNLMENHGYKLVFKKGEGYRPYFCVNTLDKVICLVNTDKDNAKTIENLLFIADIMYSK